MRTLAVLLALAGMTVTSLAADWPQFQGPQRNGIAPDTGLARVWPAQGPKVLWSFPLGVGFAGPCVEGGKLYVLDRVNDQQDVLRCLSLADGKEQWNFAYDAPGKLDRNGSRSTPSVDEKHIYTVGPFGHVHAIDKTSHQVVWKLHLLEDFKGKLPNWGVAQSALVYKDTVILAPLSPQAGLVGLNKATGQVLWKSKALGGQSYASPLIAPVDGMDQVVIQATNSVVGVEPGTGNVLWAYAGWQCEIPIPSPTPIGDGRFFVTGGYGAGCAMFKVQKKDSQYQAVELFKNKNCGSHVHNAILHQGHLYANSNNTKAGLVCLDLEGAVKWQTGPKLDFDMGNVLLADGLLYAMDGNSGTLVLAEAKPDGYKELARAKVLAGKGKLVWAPMALVDGKLIVRDQNEMKCLDVKTAGAAAPAPAAASAPAAGAQPAGGPVRPEDVQDAVRRKLRVLGGGGG